MREARRSQHADMGYTGPGRSTVLLTAAAWSLCWMTAALAEKVPSYTEPAKPQVACEDDRPANQAIRGCTDLEGAPDPDPAIRVRSYTMRGFAWLKDEEPLAANSDFDRSIAIDPTNPSAYKGRAWAYERLHQFGDAIKDWTRIIALKPGDPELYRERAYTHLLDRNYKLAVADFSQVLKLDENNLDSRIGRAISHDSMNQLSEALADFEAAIKQNPKYTAVYIARGEMWERRGKKEKAVADFENALKLGATSRRVQFALKRLGVSNVQRRRLSE